MGHEESPLLEQLARSSWMYERKDVPWSSPCVIRKRIICLVVNTCRVTCRLYVLGDKFPKWMSVHPIMSERPAKKPKMTGKYNPRRGVTRRTGGTQSTAGPKYHSYSNGNLTQGTSVVFNATDDERGSDRGTPTASTLPPTEYVQDIEGMNDLNLDMDMPNFVEEGTILPPIPRRSKKVCSTVAQRPHIQSHSIRRSRINYRNLSNASHSF